MEKIDTLTIINAHERDKYIVFEEKSHKYTILTDEESKYTSVTTVIHSHFPVFDSNEIINKMFNGKNWNPSNKYWGKTAEEIKKQWDDNGKKVSALGTELHYNIECFMNIPLEPIPCTHKDLLKEYEKENIHSISNPSEEWKFFLHFIKEHPNFKPYRTEWMIYDEDLKIAGSIDMVYENDDGTLKIYDWKRSKDIIKVNNFDKYALTECISHIPDTNFWHYSLQLNIYKFILERKYNKKVTELYLVKLHPDNKRKNYELIKCADLSLEVNELFTSLK
jgi:ATP-dependent exoDNAse (exonuclease V) beta subunit